MNKNKKPLISRKRTISRLMAVQIYYQFDFYKKEKELQSIKNEVIDFYVLQDEEAPKSYRSKIDENFVNNLVTGMSFAEKNLDEEINSILQNESMIKNSPNVMLQIIRFGAFELKFSNEIQAKTLINEYVDISAFFFPATTVTFANYALEKLARNFRKDEFC